MNRYLLLLVILITIEVMQYESNIFRIYYKPLFI